MTPTDIRSFNRAYGDNLLVAKPHSDLSMRVADALFHGITPVVLKDSPDLLKDIREAPIITSPSDAAVAFHTVFPIKEPHEFISGLCGALALISSDRIPTNMARVSWFLGRTCRFGSDITSESLVSSLFSKINKEQHETQH